MFKNLTLLYFILIIVSSCTSGEEKDHLQENTQVEEIKENTKQTNTTNKTKPVLLKTTKLLLTEYSRHGYYNNSKLEKMLMTIDEQTINQFYSLLKSYKLDKYSCCPNRTYTLSYYNENDKLYKSYYVDTTSKTDVITITESSYQYRYEIPVSKWKNILELFDRVSYNTYFIIDMKEARDVYKYVINHNLIIINNSQTTGMWPFYNGEFAFTAAVIGKNKSASDIMENITNNFPEDNFKIIRTTSESWTRDVESKGESYKEHTFVISCNKEFYDKFNLYTPKTFYKKYHAWFAVLGTKNKLKGIDIISQNENEK